MLNLLNNYKDYKILVENEETLQFEVVDNLTNEIIRLYKIYEVDHDNKTIYLEAVKHNSYILIASNDALELPLEVADNLNKAAQYMKVESTHVYRAWRNAGKPQRLKYSDFILIFLTI